MSERRDILEFEELLRRSFQEVTAESEAKMFPLDKYPGDADLCGLNVIVAGKALRSAMAQDGWTTIIEAMKQVLPSDVLLSTLDDRALRMFTRQGGYGGDAFSVTFFHPTLPPMLDRRFEARELVVAPRLIPFE